MSFSSRCEGMRSAIAGMVTGFKPFAARLLIEANRADSADWEGEARQRGAHCLAGVGATTVSRLGLGRKLLLLAIVIASIILLCETIIQGDLAGAWRTFGVPAMSPTFADTRTVTHSIECKEMGYNPYITGKCDPWGRRYNYPPGWLQLGKVSLGPATTNIAGLIIATCFILILVILNGLRRYPSAIIMVLAVLSPPVLLGLERGNTDIVIFSLACVLFYFSDPASRSYTIIISVGIVLLTALKVYPVAMAVSLVQSRHDIFLALFVSMAAIAALIVSSNDQFGHFLANQSGQWSVSRSFGAPVLPLRLTNLHQDMLLSVLSAALAACTALIALWFALRFAQFSLFLPRLDGTRVGRLALACNSVYLYCFLLQTNYDYRLVFLLPFILISLEQFESLPDYRKLWIPALVVLYFWVAPLNSWITDLASLSVFCIVFTSTGIVFLEAMGIKIRLNVRLG